MRLELPESFDYINLFDHIFLSQGVRPKRLEMLEAWFADPMTEIFLFFLPIVPSERRAVNIKIAWPDSKFFKRTACRFLQIDFVANVDMFSDDWREQENQKSGNFDHWQYFFLIFFDIVFFSNRNIYFQYNH